MNWNGFKYCDDEPCPKLNGDECDLGFNIKFRLPKSIADAVYHNWGYVKAKACRKKSKGVVKRCSQSSVMRVE